MSGFGRRGRDFAPPGPLRGSMKYVMLLLSGAADEPAEELAGRTSLEAAHTPALDRVARDGKTGTLDTLPRELPPSEAVALLSLLGYDPRRFFAGEGGLAAAGLEVGPAQGQVACMFNLATESDGLLVDHSAGQISLEEADSLLRALSARLERPDIILRPGRGFTGVMALPLSGERLPVCVPPEQVLGRRVEKHLPRGSGSETLRDIIRLSREVFQEHEVNAVRADLGENPANLLWPWGPGSTPSLPSFRELHGLRAAMVAAEECARGLGRLAGMHVPAVPGATGGYGTDYAAKARCALDLLEEFDLVAVHVASPAEASLEGNLERKVKSIADVDAMIAAPLLRRVQESGSVRLLCAATHLASVRQRRRTHEKVPVTLCGPGIEPVRDAPFSERAAENGEMGLLEAHSFLSYFLRP